MELKNLIINVLIFIFLLCMGVYLTLRVSNLKKEAQRQKFQQQLLQNDSLLKEYVQTIIDSLNKEYLEKTYDN